ncbi:hypothetical protein, partial [Streptococcus pneumoniae]|uniref:hypothetical protein n=1 Tax=Streptococcus pneumoniae TaxID=1313 RepID=UPI001CB78730
TRGLRAVAEMEHKYFLVSRIRFPDVKSSTSTVHLPGGGAARLLRHRLPKVPGEQVDPSAKHPRAANEPQ